MDWLSHFIIAVSFTWLALLSRRLGSVTHAPRYYWGLFIAAGLMVLSSGLRLVNELRRVDVDANSVWVLAYSVLPAIAITVGLVFAWRYWSWLLAERD